MEERRGRIGEMHAWEGGETCRKIEGGAEYEIIKGWKGGEGKAGEMHG